MPRVCVYSYSLLESRDGKFGVVEDDGKVTGLVGELYRRVTHSNEKVPCKPCYQQEITRLMPTT